MPASSIAPAQAEHREVSRPVAHRRDIDGLRAVAIIPVVLFHAGTGLFSGGFIGVDVFFVISGFLITGIIAREIQTGTFSIWSFYERRARRLFPALACVFLTCTLAASWMLFPGALTNFGRALKATAIFGANIHFANRDYFSPAAESEPLLHMWSLGVEEQFYIVLPVLLIIATRLKLRSALWAAGLAVISLAACQWALASAPRQVFYLLHFRAWELLLGATLALGLLPPPRSRLARESTGAAGLALIAASVFLLTSRTPFPGLTALPACLGAALVLYSGTLESAADALTFAGRILRWRPMVFTGLISYPLYLWHWPVFVFAKTYLMRELTAGETLLLIALAAVLSVLTWRYIETPIRTRRVLSGPRAVFAFTGTAAIAAFAFGQIAINLRGMPSRWPPEIAALASASRDFNPRRGACNNAALDRLRRGEVCTIGDLKTATASFAVFGDSHAAAIWPAIEAAAVDAAQKGIVLVREACPPFLGADLRSSENLGSPAKLTLPVCHEFYVNALIYLSEHPEIRTIFLIGRWPPVGALDLNQYYPGLERILKELRHKRVIMSLPIPEYPVDIPSALAKAAYAGLAPPEMTLEAFHAQKDRVKSYLLNLAASHRFETAVLSQVFCGGGRCVTIKDGRSLYQDDDHPSLYAAMLMKPIFAKGFAARLPGSAAD